MHKETQPGLCSVVCTTYNHAAYSEGSIQSIFDQKYRNIEIIVIDDGSTDGNVAVVRNKLNYSPFPSSLISQENTGNIALNLNRAMAAATGEYICFLSLDDLLLSDCLSSKVPLLEASSDMMFVANTSIVRIAEDGRTIDGMSRTPIYDKGCSTAAQLLELEYEHIGAFLMQGAVFRRAILDAVGGYDVDMTADDLIIRTKIFEYMIGRPNLTFSLLPTPGFAYRTHDQNIHRNSFRQLRAVVEWHSRYFPDRPLPAQFTYWSHRFFSQCIGERRYDELHQALAYGPELRSIYEAYRSSWKHRRRVIKFFLRNSLKYKARG